MTGRLGAAPERLGRYEIEAVLGRGGSGTVYRARDTRLGRAVALKLLRDAFPGSARRLRFEREARLAGTVSHPNVLPVLDAGQDGERSWVVTELLEGETLRERLRRGAIAPAPAVAIAVQVARGLAAIHERGIVHRDVKPENIFLTRDGGVRVLDLGLAKRDAVAEDETLAPAEFSTVDGGVAGTAAYMSPEQVRRLPVDGRTDIFALGIVLYEMLAQRRPFDEETAVETMTAILRRDAPPLLERSPGTSPVLARIAHRCLEKEPAGRFHSAHDLALALEAAAPGAAGSALLGPLPRIPVPRWGAVAVLALLLWWGAAPPRAVDEPAGQAPDTDTAHAAVWTGDAQLVRWDAKRGFVPYLGGLEADGLSFSPDGEWVAYVSLPERQLWRSRVDGTERLPLTDPPLAAALPRWSPDGRTLAFAARVEERPWRLHLVSKDGGAIEVLSPENAADPVWSTDGRSLMFGGLSDEEYGIYELDLATGRYRLLPGTLGLFSPRRSPDGRWIAALRQDTQDLLVREVGTSAWQEVVPGVVNYPTWLDDGEIVFSWDGPDTPRGMYRVRPGARPELVASLAGVTLAGGDWGLWTGATPDGQPLVLRTATWPDAAGPALPAFPGEPIDVQSSDAEDRWKKLLPGVLVVPPPPPPDL